MAAFSSKPEWGEAKPLLKRGVTIKLNDGSKIKLSPEIASKFETVRTVLAYGGIEVGEEEDIIKIFDYPAQYVRHYFQLVNKIDGRKELPNIHFTQLFDFFLIASLMGNETSMTNLADYILATALANQSATKEVKAAMREIYLSFPAGPKQFIMNRLAELNRAISLKTLRNLNFKHLGDVVAIDNQGRIITKIYVAPEGIPPYYDETDPQRQTLINELEQQGALSRVQIGGGTKEGVTMVVEKYGQNALYKYLPGQTKDQYLIPIRREIDIWELSPHGSRFRVITLEDKAKIVKIHDLTDGSLIFSYKITLFYDPLVEIIYQEEYDATDDTGRYFLVTSMDNSERYINAKLFSVGEMVRGTNGKMIRQNRELFEIKIPGHNNDRRIGIVDSHRQLIYIYDNSSHNSRRPPRIGEPVRLQVYRREGVYEANFKILLVVDFSGQVLHRYVYRGKINIFPTKHLLTRESGMGQLTEEDIQYIVGPEVSDKVKEEMKKLPQFELWPTSFLENSTVGSVAGRNNLWIRDATKDFKIAALVKQNAGEIQKITSSPSGDIIALPSVEYVPPGAPPDSAVMQTVLYTDHEMEIINEVLSGPAKG